VRKRRMAACRCFQEVQNVSHFHSRHYC
jgi:hypothetical protein